MSQDPKRKLSFLAPDGRPRLRRGRLSSGLVLTFVGLSLLNQPLAQSVPPRFASESLARQAFSNLLKISSAYPGVRALEQGRSVSGALVTEDLSWESPDGLQVPVLVIRPESIERPLPAIICLHGSSGSRESMSTETFGRGSWTRYGASEPHQRLMGWARELARRGFLVLAMTQRGLDARVPNTNDQAKDLLVRGRTLMGAIVTEIRQAVTYLSSRPDVAADRIGVTGMSFGGITTLYAWFVDDRIAAAAPVCGGVGSVDTFLRIGSRGYHGFYWWVPDMLAVGDQGDFAAALAPRPLFVWAPLGDIGMPKEGVDHFLELVRPTYESLGASETLEVWRPAGEHSFSMAAFEAMEAFFDTHLR